MIFPGRASVSNGIFSLMAYAAYNINNYLISISVAIILEISLFLFCVHEVCLNVCVGTTCGLQRPIEDIRSHEAGGIDGLKLPHRC